MLFRLLRWGGPVVWPGVAAWPGGTLPVSCRCGRLLSRPGWFWWRLLRAAEQEQHGAAGGLGRSKVKLSSRRPYFSITSAAPETGPLNPDDVDGMSNR